MGEIVVTPIPMFTRKFHLMNADGISADTLFDVTARPWSRTLRVTGLKTSTRIPNIYWWRDEAAKRYPRADTVIYERMTPEGLVSEKWAIRPVKPSLWQRYWRLVVPHLMLLIRGVK